MPWPIETFDNGEQRSSIRSKYNNAIDMLGTAYYGFAAFSASTTSQSIDPDTWTKVLFDTLVVNDTGIVLGSSGADEGKLLFPYDDSLGVYDLSALISWSNNDGESSVFRRRMRIRATGGFQVIVDDAPNFDPNMGDLDVPTNHQVNVRASHPYSSGANQETWVEVWHNASSAVNIVRSAIDAPLFEFCRVGKQA